MPRSLASMRASHAALCRSAQSDPREMTAAARKGFEDKWLREVDEKAPGLPDDERERRAEALKKAHYQKMAIASVEKRAKRR